MYYFAVIETDADYGNVGTIAAITQAELASKLIDACQSHFDSVVDIVKCPNLKEITRGEEHEAIVRVYSDDSPDADYYDSHLEITQTWLY